MRANTLLAGSKLAEDLPPRQAVLYTLLIPIPGEAHGPRPDLLDRVQALILAEFGGVTTFTQSQGLWIGPSGSIYKDSLLPVQCVAPAGDLAESWFRDLTAEIAAQTGCLEVFLLKQPVTTLHKL